MRSVLRIAYTGDLEKVREEAVQAVHKLTVDLKNPTTISEVGATEADLEPLAHDAFHDVCTPATRVRQPKRTSSRFTSR